MKPVGVRADGEGVVSERKMLLASREGEVLGVCEVGNSENERGDLSLETTGCEVDEGVASDVVECDSIGEESPSERVPWVASCVLLLLLWWCSVYACSSNRLPALTHSDKKSNETICAPYSSAFFTL